MRILVTNDDGIHAPGLKSLERIARALSDDVWVVAPETDQSGSSHSLSLNDPLRLREVTDRHFAVRGTPSDSVIMGVRHVLDGPPDLVLSGVNRGQNIAEDVAYSGTIAGAFEGSMIGIRSVALSQAYGFGEKKHVRWETAEHHGPDVLRRILDADLPTDVVANVNFPDIAPDEVKGVEITVQGRRDQAMLDIEGRRDGRGNPYYWLTFSRQPSQPAAGTDLWAVYGGLISITPLRLDFTAENARGTLEARFNAASAAE